METIKLSKYTIQFKTKGNYLVYNSFTNSFLEVEEKLFNIITDARKGKTDILEQLDDSTKDQLFENGILVSNPKDNFNELKLMRHLRRFRNDFLSLTIAPTFACNFRCEYCFEENFQNKKLSSELKSEIINFIKGYDVKHLNITWYGGEPLLVFDDIVELNKLISDLDVNYNSSIITNGYLLSEETIKKFDELRIKSIQITIDGPKEIHNARRPHVSNKDSFTRIMNNIDLLKKFYKGHVKIRVNIDNENAKYYPEVFKSLKIKHPKAFVYPGFVTTDITLCKSVGGCSFTHNDKAKFKINNYKKHKIIEDTLFPTLVNSECMARQINSYLIDPEGNLYKCWEHIGKDEFIVGNLLDGEKANNDMLTRYLTGADPLSNPMCTECNLLPICDGGCPHQLVQNLYTNSNYDTCSTFKDHIEQFLELHYNHKLEIEKTTELI